MMDGNGLAAFVAVAEERNFSRAADRLGTVQSVISKRLQRLEDVVGTLLIDRTVRSDIRLTREGQHFLTHATETLVALQRTERFGISLGRGSAGPLRIGYVFSAAMNGTLGAICRAIHGRLPEIEISPRLMETPAQLTALEACLLDVALIRPRPTVPEGCRAIEIHSENLCICLPHGHLLAKKEAIALRDLADQCFIVPQLHEHVGLIDNIRRLADAGGFTMPRIIRSDDFVTAACLASASMGLVLAPESLRNLHIDGVDFRPILNFSDRLCTVLVHRNDAPRDAVQMIVRLFLDEQATRGG